MSRAGATGVAGPPRGSSGRALSWCVTGGGKATAVLSSNGRIGLIGTTARGRAPGRAARGSSLRKLRGVHGKLRRVGRGVYGASRRGPFVFGVRRGKVRYVAVTHSRMSRSQTTAHLRLAGLR